MPKIKNWSKIEDTNPGTTYLWEHDDLDYEVEVVTQPMQEDKTYSVLLHKDGEMEEVIADHNELKQGEPITDKENARKIAVSYMEDNPYPGKSFWIDSDSEYDSLKEAEEALAERFKEFEEDNESFFFECVVHDDEGFTAVVSVDFGIEDFEEDWSYPANIIAFKDDQPTDDKETIVESSAVHQAEQIVRNGAMKGLSYYNENPMPGDPRIRQEYEDRGNQVTGFMDIMWRKPER